MKGHYVLFAMAMVVSLLANPFTSLDTRAWAADSQESASNIHIMTKHLSYREKDQGSSPDEMPKREYDISYPIVSYQGHPAIEEKINSLILSTYERFELNFRRIDQSTWDGLVQGNFKILYQTPRILGIRIGTYVIKMTAAHGGDSVTVYNIDLTNGQNLLFKDIARSSQRKGLDKLVVKKLKTLEQAKCIFFDSPIKVKDDQGYYLKDGDFVVVFPKYEIAAGACGVIELPIPVEEMKPFLNPESPFYSLL